jgi:hypothetical protein
MTTMTTITTIELLPTDEAPFQQSKDVYLRLGTGGQISVGLGYDAACAAPVLDWHGCERHLAWQLPAGFLPAAAAELISLVRWKLEEIHSGVVTLPSGQRGLSFEAQMCLGYIEEDIDNMEIAPCCGTPIRYSAVEIVDLCAECDSLDPDFEHMLEAAGEPQASLTSSDICILLLGVAVWVLTLALMMNV